ncbi:hypothetical protein HELRODRAFT_64272 [Helobdella robusta]|uniref:D-2-hydroxyglutarate dehydrogenase, mitochondrial n=1 Tax=Helobdella robusta TaxID=6412 RepID=T1FXS1_HELRO|nr:hypothetical protein HELRODRAFT_64272 [Helobdella robusta]ESO06630.1 hypothetical protein HELRODRAFT_64272 [Helobdella robusta]
MLLQNEDVINYNVDWLRRFRGNSRLVLRPKTTEHISKILKYCNERRLAVVPQGGNTGLVGGSVPLFDEIILSTQLMNEIINFDCNSGVLTCQSGCVLENLSANVSEHGYMMPLDLGSKGSCNIGGNISTNAGGIRLIRFGSLHGSTLGLEAVTADGSVIDCLTSMRKDNVGYHLKHLFIGSEGTLGIVTKVSILCPKAPSSVNLALLGCSNFDDVLKILALTKSNLGEILSAFEFLDAVSMRCSERYLSQKCPIQSAPFYVLIETSGSNDDHDQEKLGGLLEAVSSSGLIVDGTLATDLSKISTLWKLRESITLGLLEDGFCYKYDVSLPLSSFYDIVTLMEDKLKELPYLKVCGYGHVADGNLHFNVTSRIYDERISGTIEKELYKFVASAGGSISAEHGVGQFKRDHMTDVKSPEVLSLMRNIKSIMDPHCILNPYKVIP